MQRDIVLQAVTVSRAFHTDIVCEQKTNFILTNTMLFMVIQCIYKNQTKVAEYDSMYVCIYVQYVYTCVCMYLYFTIKQN